MKKHIFASLALLAIAAPLALAQPEWLPNRPPQVPNDGFLLKLPVEAVQFFAEWRTLRTELIDAVKIGAGVGATLGVLLIAILYLLVSQRANQGDGK